MFSNLEDLKRIRDKTSHNKDLKIKIAETINDLQSKVERVKILSVSKQRNTFIEMVKPYTEARQTAFRNGATSEASPIWAVPAVCESWLFGYINGSKEEIKEIEKVINQLSNPDRKEKGKVGEYFGKLLVFIGTPLAFYYLNWWLAIIVLMFGVIVTGWKSRYNGPFNVK